MFNTKSLAASTSALDAPPQFRVGEFGAPEAANSSNQSSQSYVFVKSLLVPNKKGFTDVCARSNSVASVILSAYPTLTDSPN